MTRVVIASRIFEPEGGAAAFRLAALARALTSSGYDVTVLTTRPPDADVSSTRTVKRWPVLRDRAGAVRGYVSYASFDVPLFFRLLFRRRPDVIVAETPPTTGFAVLLASWLMRRPYVYFAADILSTAAEGIGVSRVVVAILRRVEALVLKRAAHVLTVSGGVSDEVKRFGVPAEHISDVGTGVDTDLFAPAGEHRSGGDQTLVYAGTLSEIQGAGVFIDAFVTIADEFPDARLVVFGRGTEEPEMRQRAAMTPAIDFRGQVDGPEVAAWLRSARAGLASVRPRRGYDFAFATKAFSSLSCGTPVLYAGVGPTRTVIETHDLGIGVDWDVESVAAAMRRVLGTTLTDDERARISAWARANVSLDAVAAKAVAAIDDVVSGL